MTDKTASRPEETASWKKLTKLAELASQTHNRERMGEPCAPASTVGGQEKVLRDYGVGAQILLDLGVRDMILLTNAKQRTIVGLEGYGLRVVGQQAIDVTLSDLGG